MGQRLWLLVDVFSFKTNFLFYLIRQLVVQLFSIALPESQGRAIPSANETVDFIWRWCKFINPKQFKEMFVLLQWRKWWWVCQYQKQEQNENEKVGNRYVKYESLFLNMPEHGTCILIFSSPTHSCNRTPIWFVDKMNADLKIWHQSKGNNKNNWHNATFS